MALSVAGLCVLWLDVLLRRLFFPVILLSGINYTASYSNSINIMNINHYNLYVSTAIIFRYNLISFVYLLLFVVALFLPGPRLGKQKCKSKHYSYS